MKRWLRWWFGLASLAGLLLAVPVMAQPIDCGWDAGRSATHAASWILLSDGQDEERQEVRLGIWGSERITTQCADLDRNGVQELVVVSRSAGTGPYYRLQIAEFAQGGIATWSYASAGAPRIDGTRIFLGRLVGGYQGAASQPEFVAHAYRSGFGLVGDYEPRWWLQFITFSLNGETIHLVGAEFPMRDSCEASAELTRGEFAAAGTEAVVRCESNADLRRLLDLVTH